MDEFIFGPLPPVEERLRRELALRGGIIHRQARQPFHPKPGQPTTLTLTVGPQHPALRAWVYWSAGCEEPRGRGGVAQSGQVIPMQPSEATWDSSLWGYLRSFHAELPGQPEGSVIRYRIGLETDSGEVLADDEACYAYHVDDWPPPAWTRDALIYQIFVDRFHPGPGRQWLSPANLSGFYGGRISGITYQLDYLVSLGVNTLWLSPIFPSPTHHGYDITDYMDVEPRLGTKDDLRELLDAAHTRGMHVLLDFVPNHCSSLHPFFQQAQSQPNSPYREWFTFTHWPDEYARFFGEKRMPRINLRHPAARSHLLDAAAFWLKFGVDGFRVDHAIGPTPDFWADFRKAVRASQPDAWVFGEVTDPPPIQLKFAGGMDGCLDFLLTEALRKTFFFATWDAAQLGEFLERHNAFFPADFSRPSFMDNHDMNRALFAAGGDQRRLRLAALCQFTLPGQPVLYHGTEVGLSQEHDVHEKGRGLEEARLPHPWGAAQDRELFSFFQSLLALRRTEPAMRANLVRIETAPEGVLAYRLPPPAGEPGAELLVALNLAPQPREISVAGSWVAVLASGQPGIEVRVDVTRVVLGALEGMILKRGVS